MKRSKFTEEQLAFALKQAELGISVEEGCRKMGISDATFYVWRKKYGGAARRSCADVFNYIKMFYNAKRRHGSGRRHFAC